MSQAKNPKPEAKASEASPSPQISRRSDKSSARGSSEDVPILRYGSNTNYHSFKEKISTAARLEYGNSSLLRKRCVLYAYLSDCSSPQSRRFRRQNRGRTFSLCRGNKA